jgi:hypothetical protein
VKVTVHIERLVIDGLAVEHGAVPELRGAVTAEITRLLTSEAVPAWLLRGGAAPAIRAPGMTAAPHGSMAAWGAQIGRAVYRSFGP